MNEQNQIPYAPMAEKAVLSIMMREASRIALAAAEGIGADMFHLPAHKTIHGLLVDERDAGNVSDGGEIDISVLIQKASLSGLLETIGGPSAIADIYTYEPTAQRWSTWLGLLRESKALRIAAESPELLLEAADSTEAIQVAKDILKRLETAITAKTRAIKADKACEDWIKTFIKRSENTGAITGESTGIYELDQITGGLRPGEFWVVAGPRSAGKSALMYQIASALLKESKTISIFSAELMNNQIIDRLLCLVANVPYSCVNGREEAKKHELEKIQTALKIIKSQNLWLDASAGQSIDSVIGEARKIRDITGKVDLIVVDYIQIFKGFRHKGENREREVASISAGLKNLAKDLECPVISASQLNKNWEARESMAIEQDADIMISIKDNKLIMSKNRDGVKDGEINLALDGARQRFCRYTTE